MRDLRTALDTGGEFTLIDVRTPAEWQAGHIAQALHKPLAEIIEKGVDFCLSGPVSVICGSGYRSNIVGSLLKASGCQTISSVAGGMLAWTRSGHPVAQLGRRKAGKQGGPGACPGPPRLSGSK